MEQSFIRKLRLVLGDEGRGEGSAEGVFNDLFIFAGAEQHTDGGLFVDFFHVAVQRFEVEAELAEILRLKPSDFEFEGDQAIEAAVEKEQVEREVAAADLDREFGADEAEIAAELDQEVSEFEQQSTMQVGFGVVGRAERGTPTGRHP